MSLTKNRIVAVLKAATYIILHFGQIKKDFLETYEAVADFQLTKEEADRIQKSLSKHMSGLGIS